MSDVPMAGESRPLLPSLDAGHLCEKGAASVIIEQHDNVVFFPGFLGSTTEQCCFLKA